ncbi:MAG TPA: 16S rRNA (uracil(1498)-N(3))-methyltransferase [Candidatus Binatia bacterium]|nr:16S rRNA (uracil(1498)-N(3))-methyltransferase [Candidatus Binatia bacterium]
MNLVLLERDEVCRQRAVVRGRRRDHIAMVHRAQAGKTLRVGIVGGMIGTGTVVAVDDEAVELDVELDANPPAPLPCTLVLALPRPKVLRRILQASSAFGIKHVVLMNAFRVEKSYWQTPVLQAETMREELLSGLEQARDTILASVAQKRLFRPFVEDELNALAAGSRLLVAHPQAAKECPRGVTDPVTLVVGPEGGFVPFELDLLARAGATAVSLGVRPLRVEQALAALLGRLF